MKVEEFGKRDVYKECYGEEESRDCEKYCVNLELEFDHFCLFGVKANKSFDLKEFSIII